MSTTIYCGLVRARSLHPASSHKSLQLSMNDETDSVDRPPQRALQSQEGVHIVRTGPRRREAHLSVITPISSTSGTTGVRELIASRVYREACAWLAWYHLSEQLRHVVPEIADRLVSCDIDFTLQMHDSQFSPLVAAQELFDTVNKLDESNVTSLQPMAVIGAARSAVSSTLSTLNSAYRIPQISASSTAALLDNKDAHPFFARTVPSNEGDALAIAAYLESIGVSHVAVVYIADSFGTNFHANLVEAASAKGIEVFSAPYDDEGQELAVASLAESQVRYMVGIFSPTSLNAMLRYVVQYDLAGPGFTWLFTEGNADVVSPSFRLNRIVDGSLTKVLHGAGVFTIDMKPHPGLDTALRVFRDSAMQREIYQSLHREADIFDNYTYPADSGTILYQYLTYDAVMAIAIAACEVPSDLFTGEELYQQLVKTKFKGVSGTVAFDEATGTRRSTDFVYRLRNLRVADTGGDEIAFEVTAVADIFLANDTIASLSAFRYADGGTVPHLSLTPVDQDPNLIPASIRGFGLGLGGFVLLSSVLWLAWSVIYRKSAVVRSSQPVFLCQLCVGTFLMGSAVIPMSLQEPVGQNGLDRACMAVPWLLSVGFVTSFSALFSKTWRLNKICQSGQFLRRIIVHPKDVMMPFVVMMALNIGLLVVWTIVSPLRWDRLPVDNFDQFGRSVESYGTCRAGDGVPVAAFVLPIVAVNLSALLFSSYQAYCSRVLPTDFSESTYLGLSMASLLETFFLGVPMLFIDTESPSTMFIVRSVLVCLSCLAIQVPMFVPKYIQRNMIKRERRSMLDRTGNGSQPRGRLRNTIHIRISGLSNRFLTDSGSNLGISVPEGDQASSGGEKAVGATKVKRSKQYYQQTSNRKDRNPNDPSSKLRAKFLAVFAGTTMASAVEPEGVDDSHQSERAEHSAAIEHVEEDERSEGRGTQRTSIPSAEDVNGASSGGEKSESSTD